MEQASHDNVYYIDEYPEIKKRVWLRRLAESRLGKAALSTELTQIIPFNPPEQPDPPGGAA